MKITKVTLSASCRNAHRLGMIAVLLVFAVPIIAFAQYSGVGYHAAPFLKISPSARQVALGGAFTALTNDMNMMRYNVGGLGGLENTSFAVNFNTWIDDTQQGNVAVGLPFRFGTLGADLSYFDEGSIVKLDPDFTATGGEALSGDVLLSLGYGKFFNVSTFKVGVGLAYKYLNQNLVGETNSVSALDVGVQMHLPQYLHLGAAIQNYGLKNVQFDVWESPLPETYRFGAALEFPIKTWNLIVSSDASWVTKEEIKYQMGSELVVNNVFALRGGYKFNDASVSSWGVGFGLYVPTEWLGRSQMRFDYAYAPLKAFDEAAHRFSLHFAFGTIEAKQVSEDDLARRLAEADSLRRAAEEAERAARLAAAKMDSLQKEMQQRWEYIQQIIEENPKLTGERSQEDEREITVTMRINFDFDKANIRPNEFETMRQVGEILNTYPEAIVHLSGHTDWIGSHEYNIHLSHRRVDSVMAFLSMKEKVNPDRFYMPVGYGETRPVATNETDEGRFMNRRVEFHLYTFDAPPKMPEGTAIRRIVAADNQTIQVVCNGQIPIPQKTMFLEDPSRYVIDFEKIYLLSNPTTYTLNTGNVTQARVAFHGENEPDVFTRVAFDLVGDIQPRIERRDNLIIIKLE